MSLSLCCSEFINKHSLCSQTLPSFFSSVLNITENSFPLRKRPMTISLNRPSVVKHRTTLFIFFEIWISFVFLCQTFTAPSPPKKDNVTIVRLLTTQYYLKKACSVRNRFFCVYHGMHYESLRATDDHPPFQIFNKIWII